MNYIPFISFILCKYLEWDKHDSKESKNKQHWASALPLIGSLDLLLGEFVSKESANSNIIICYPKNKKPIYWVMDGDYLITEVLYNTILLFELLTESNFKGPLILLIFLSFFLFILAFQMALLSTVIARIWHSGWSRSYLKICWRQPVGAGTTGSSSSSSCLVPVLKHRGRHPQQKEEVACIASPQPHRRLPSRTGFLQSSWAWQTVPFLEMKNIRLWPVRSWRVRRRWWSTERREACSSQETESWRKELSLLWLMFHFPLPGPKAQLN